MSMPSLQKPSKLKPTLTVLFILLIFYGSAIQSDVSIGELLKGFPEMGKLLNEMWPPDWSYIEVAWDPMLDTIRMAILGTTTGAILAIPVALLAARNVTTVPVLTALSRFI